uniref:Uncharacterized protein n=1 Tax=Triticum urartu TaxID=4572 RepID=A0A8R7THG9_TRIUA
RPSLPARYRHLPLRRRHVLVVLHRPSSLLLPRRRQPLQLATTTSPSPWRTAGTSPSSSARLCQLARAPPPASRPPSVSYHRTDAPFSQESPPSGLASCAPPPPRDPTRRRSSDSSPRLCLQFFRRHQWPALSLSLWFEEQQLLGLQCRHLKTEEMAIIPLW